MPPTLTTPTTTSRNTNNIAAVRVALKASTRRLYAASCLPATKRRTLGVLFPRRQASACHTLRGRALVGNSSPLDASREVFTAEIDCPTAVRFSSRSADSTLEATRQALTDFHVSVTHVSTYHRRVTTSIFRSRPPRRRQYHQCRTVGSKPSNNNEHCALVLGENGRALVTVGSSPELGACSDPTVVSTAARLLPLLHCQNQCAQTLLISSKTTTLIGCNSSRATSAASFLEAPTTLRRDSQKV